MTDKPLDCIGSTQQLGKIDFKDIPLPPGATHAFVGYGVKEKSEKLSREELEIIEENIRASTSIL